jgi:cell division protein FtsB
MDFTLNEWLIVGLVFLFGLLLGAALASGGGRKHKARYKEETRRVAELEAENVRLRKEVKDAEINAVSARARAPVDRP